MFGYPFDALSQRMKERHLRPWKCSVVQPLQEYSTCRYGHRFI